MASLLERLDASAGAAVVALMFFGGLSLGTLTLAVGLWRARAVPRGAVVLLVAFLVMDFGPGEILGVDPHVLLVFSFGWIGLKVLAMSDAEWRHTNPETAETDASDVRAVSVSR